VKKVGVPFKREDWVALGTTRMEACVPTAGRSRPRSAVLDRRRPARVSDWGRSRWGRCGVRGGEGAGVGAPAGVGSGGAGGENADRRSQSVG
jgi:hypothetical protein